MTYARLKQAIEPMWRLAMRWLFPPRIQITGSIYLCLTNPDDRTYHLVSCFFEPDWSVRLEDRQVTALFACFDRFLKNDHKEDEVLLKDLNVRLIRKKDDIIAIETEKRHNKTTSHTTIFDLSHSLRQYSDLCK